MSTDLLMYAQALTKVVSQQSMQTACHLKLPVEHTYSEHTHRLDTEKHKE